MKKGVFGRQFKRDIDERTALFRGLVSALILKEKIKTTEAKAKAIKSQVEKIVTKAKKGEEARNFLQRFVYQDALDKLIVNIAPRFEKRQGGYTRIIKLGERLSDKAKVVLMEWVEGPKEIIISKEPAKEELTQKDKKATKTDKPKIKKEIKK